MRYLMIAVFTFALIMVTNSPAWAQEGQLIAKFSPPGVYVWKSSSALDEGQALLIARADHTLIAPLVACRVETGTRAVNAGSWRVVVLEGPQKGCRGVIDRRDWKWKGE
jgi:hypothetical protein